MSSIKINRWIALTLLLTLLVGSGLAEESTRSEDPAAYWAIFRQNDPKYRNTSYPYGGRYLIENGCGICSVVNALSASAGLTWADETLADEFLRECLWFLTEKNKPEQNTFAFNQLADLNAVDAAAYPSVASVMADYQGNVLYADDKITAAGIQRLLGEPKSGSHQMLIAAMDRNSGMEVMVETALWLHEHGLDDAMVTLFAIVAGSESTGAPFASKRGHYVDILLRVGEYAETGSFYLLDSFPRSMGVREERRNKVLYETEYYFVEHWRNMTFRKIYEPIRLQPTVIRFQPREEYLSPLRENGTLYDPDARMKLLERVITYGMTGIIVSIP